MTTSLVVAVGAVVGAAGDVETEATVIGSTAEVLVGTVVLDRLDRLDRRDLQGLHHRMGLQATVEDRPRHMRKLLLLRR